VKLAWEGGMRVEFVNRLSLTLDRWRKPCIYARFFSLNINPCSRPGSLIISSWSSSFKPHLEGAAWCVTWQPSSLGKGSWIKY
jgi:hypothetical protein